MAAVIMSRTGRAMIQLQAGSFQEEKDWGQVLPVGGNNLGQLETESALSLPP